MKRYTSLMFCLIFAVFFVFSESTYAQQTLPDYTKWQLIGNANYPAVHNGNNVTLFIGVYANLDVNNLNYDTAFIIHNEWIQPWIALYSVDVVYKDGNDYIVASNSRRWLFENTGNGWSFVKDFSQSQNLDQETQDFIASRYNLEF